MLVYVDYEHADLYATDRGDGILAARTRITYRLEDLSGQPTMLVRWDRITPELLSRLGATGIFISGNGTDLDLYAAADLEPLTAIVRDSGLPVFGFCGGFQFMAQALGERVVPMDIATGTEETDLLKKTPEGKWFEYGYFPIEVTGEHELLEGWTDAPTFRHAHGLHVPQVPSGFEVYGSTASTPVQIAIDDDRRMIGTQFHPEYWTDDHPAGRTLIANFMRWAGLSS